MMRFPQPTTTSMNHPPYTPQDHLEAWANKPDPQSDIARLAAHRDLHRTVPADVSAARRQEAEVQRTALGNCQTSLQHAIAHLHAILNSQRTATQSWQAEQEARQWLASIGSEAP